MLIIFKRLNFIEINVNFMEAQIYYIPESYYSIQISLQMLNFLEYAILIFNYRFYSFYRGSEIFILFKFTNS